MQYNPSTLKVCLFDGVHDDGINVFRDRGFQDIQLFPDSLPETELREVLKTANIVGVRSKTKLTESLLESSQNLLCIGRYGIGVNNVDLQASEKLGIPVFNGPHSSTRSVAEWVIGSIFGLFRKISEKSAEMHQGKWKKGSKNCIEIRGKTLGLVGYGNVAAQISIMAESLGMNVVYTDVRKVLPLGNAKQVSFDEVLQKSDVISLHVPALPSTKDMINKKTLNQMKKGSYLINSSRGSVVNLSDLKIALESEHLLGAALDVFPAEPKSKEDPFECELLNNNNVIFTPHIAGSTEESQSSLGIEVSDKMASFATFGDSSTALNFPQISQPLLLGLHRIILIHKNKPGVMADINNIIAESEANIASQILKTQGDIGMVMIDIEKIASENLSKKLNNLSFIIKCLILS